jgi:hypothetical protein
MVLLLDSTVVTDPNQAATPQPTRVSPSSVAWLRRDFAKSLEKIPLTFIEPVAAGCSASEF